MDYGKTIIILLVCVVIYFIPTFIANGRKTHNENGIAIVNVLLGWTVVGWIIALIMACGSRSKDTVEIIEEIEPEEIVEKPDRVAMLERIAKLKADGVLSDEEFNDEKKRILATA